MERSIEEATRELDDITGELAREETYENPDRARALSDAYQRMKTQLGEWTRQWESTASELEELEKRFEESKRRLTNLESEEKPNR